MAWAPLGTAVIVFATLGAAHARGLSLGSRLDLK
ncbi:MAG: hypothetical protein JWO57_4008 [Pseudonocardiales bacterium]|nr:hypothetical protein [Pseudonocardiales bacterium]